VAGTVKVTVTATQAGITQRQKDRLKLRLQQLGCTVLIHGCCVGGDNDADLIAVELGLGRIGLPSTITPKRVPDAVLYKRGPHLAILAPRPPLERNGFAVEMGEYLIVLPKTHGEELRSGTWATYRYNRKGPKKPYEIIWPDAPAEEATL
jgi:hypothetical protein